MFGFFSKSDDSRPLISQDKKGPERTPEAGPTASATDRDEAEVLLAEMQRRDEDHRLAIRQREKDLKRKHDNEMAIQGSEIMKMREALEVAEQDRADLELQCETLRSELQRTHCDAITTTMEKKRSSDVHRVVLDTTKSRVAALRADLQRLSSEVHLARLRATSAEQQLDEYKQDAERAKQQLKEARARVKRAEEARVGTDAARVAALKRAAQAELRAQRATDDAARAAAISQEKAISVVRGAAEESQAQELRVLREELAGAQQMLLEARAAEVERDVHGESGEGADGNRASVFAAALEAAEERAMEAEGVAAALEREMAEARAQEEARLTALRSEQEALQVRTQAAIREARALRAVVAELKGAIRVVVRVRPAPRRTGAAAAGGSGGVALRVATEAAAAGVGKLLVDTSSGGTQEGARQHVRPFEVDSALGPASSQAQAFAEVSDAVGGVVQGVDCAVLSYGQTGSGKTYTMLGPEEYSQALAEGSAGADAQSGAGLLSLEQAGLIPRAVQRLFEAADEARSCGEGEPQFHLSMLEIYNEQIRDLLPRRPGAAGGAGEGEGEGDDSGVRQVVARLVDPARAAASVHPSHGGLVLEGLQEMLVTEPQDVVRAVLHGLEARASSKTCMNERSSRSHLVVRVRARVGQEQVDAAEGGSALEGVLTLVDLAGSERLARSGAEGAARREAQHINKSLSALGNVLSALQRKTPHVPFRDSALTSLLSPCLTPGAGGRAVLFAHVSPLGADVQESTCTLEFATRAARVQLGRATARRTIEGTGSESSSGARGNGDPAATRAKQDLLRTRTQLAREKARGQEREREIEKLRRELAKQRQEAAAAARDAKQARESSGSTGSRASARSKSRKRGGGASRAVVGAGKTARFSADLEEWRPLSVSDAGEGMDPAASAHRPERLATSQVARCPPTSAPSAPAPRLPPKTPMRVSRPRTKRSAETSSARRQGMPVASGGSLRRLRAKSGSRSNLVAKSSRSRDQRTGVVPPATPIHLGPSCKRQTSRSCAAPGLQASDAGNTAAIAKVSQRKCSGDGWKARVRNARSRLDCGQSQLRDASRSSGTSADRGATLAADSRSSEAVMATDVHVSAGLLPPSPDVGDDASLGSQSQCGSPTARPASLLGFFEGESGEVVGGL